MIRSILEKLLDAGAVLDARETEQVFAAMLAGELTEPVIAAVLAAWRVHGESAQELTIGARALRKAAASVPLPASARPLVDNCGTGGDGSNSFNLSTAAAIVASAAGARVAKHGNRSISSKCGSADLLFAAGFPDALTPDAAAGLLARRGFTFFFAPSYHPVMRHVAPVRRALGVRTVFNLLGPLANPIAPEGQLIGVGAKRYLRPMAEALAALGTRRGLVVHSRDGLDELSPATLTDGVAIEGGRLVETVVDPASLGVAGSLADLEGGDPAFNLARLNELLDGRASSGLEGAVALNAGAVLWIAEVSATLAEGVAAARTALRSGKARTHFDAWIADAKAQAPTQAGS